MDKTGEASPTVFDKPTSRFMHGQAGSSVTGSKRRASPTIIDGLIALLREPQQNPTTGLVRLPVATVAENNHSHLGLSNHA